MCSTVAVVRRVLVYKQEFTDRIDAGRREKELKGFSRAKKFKLVKALRPEGLRI